MGRLLDEDDVIDAINKRISVLQKHPEFRRKHADIDLYGIKPMIAELPSAQPVDKAYLCDWYINSVTESEPIWTEAHISELMGDFYIIPKRGEQE